jgi:hypothetical protein
MQYWDYSEGGWFLGEATASCCTHWSEPIKGIRTGAAPNRIPDRDWPLPKTGSRYLVDRSQSSACFFRQVNLKWPGISTNQLTYPEVLLHLFCVWTAVHIHKLPLLELRSIRIPGRIVPHKLHDLYSIHTQKPKALETHEAIQPIFSICRIATSEFHLIHPDSADSLWYNFKGRSWSCSAADKLCVRRYIRFSCLGDFTPHHSVYCAHPHRSMERTSIALKPLRSFDALGDI